MNWGGGDDRKALVNVAACQGVLSSRVAEVRRNLLGTPESVASPDVDSAIVEAE